MGISAMTDGDQLSQINIPTRDFLITPTGIEKGNS